MEDKNFLTWNQAEPRILALLTGLGISPGLVQGTRIILDENQNCSLELGYQESWGLLTIRGSLFLDHGLRDHVLLSLSTVAEKMLQYGCAFFPTQDESSIILSISAFLPFEGMGFSDLGLTLDRVRAALMGLQTFYDDTFFGPGGR